MIDATERQEFLINEVLRFYSENGRPPQQHDMIGDNGYPNPDQFSEHFETWNELLFTAAHEYLKNKAWERHIGS